MDKQIQKLQNIKETLLPWKLIWQDRVQPENGQNKNIKETVKIDLRLSLIEVSIHIGVQLKTPFTYRLKETKKICKSQKMLITRLFSLNRYSLATRWSNQIHQNTALKLSLANISKKIKERSNHLILKFLMMRLLSQKFMNIFTIM